MTSAGEGVLGGKTVLITGGGRGLGEAYARLAAAEGAAVVVNDIDEGPAKDVVASIIAGGGLAVAHVGDISDWVTAGQAVQTAIDTFGALDGLVNNAGVYTMHRPYEQDAESFLRIIQVNVLGVAYTGMHALRHMQSRDRGSIVNAVSGAHAGMEGMSAYGASKGAVVSLTYGWAVDMQGTGVRVNAISPLATTRLDKVLVDFHGLDESDPRHPANHSPVPAANAPAVVYLLSDRSVGVHGQVIRVDHDVLSLVSHPLNLEPRVPEGAESVGQVEKAFDDVLKPMMQPVGLHSGRVSLT